MSVTALELVNEAAHLLAEITRAARSCRLTPGTVGGYATPRTDYTPGAAVSRCGARARITTDRRCCRVRGVSDRASLPTRP